MVDWFARQTAVLNGFSSIALTKLMFWIIWMRLRFAQDTDGQAIDFLPLDKKKQAALEPIYQTVPEKHGKKFF